MNVNFALLISIKHSSYNSLNVLMPIFKYFKFLNGQKTYVLPITVITVLEELKFTDHIYELI